MSSKIKNEHLLKKAAFLNGAWVTNTNTFPVTNPATGINFAIRKRLTLMYLVFIGELIAELPRMGVADVELGAKFAFDSWKGWKKTTGC